MHLQDPTFPPLLTGHGVASPERPFEVALKSARGGKSGAGELYWARNVDRMEFAVVLEPDVGSDRCPEMLYLGMVAFSDALGAVAPPEVAVTFLWPNLILVNGAIVGKADLVISDSNDEAIPNWMIFGLIVNIRPGASSPEPGEQLADTFLHLEGCGGLDRTTLIESTARHMVNWIYTWSEDGFRPVHQEWTGRYHDEAKMGGLQDDVKSREKLPGTWKLMDEQGNAVFQKSDGTSGLIKTIDNLHARGV